MARRQDRAQEALLIYTIQEMFLDPFRDVDDFIPDDEKLSIAFGVDYRRIYRRRIVKPMKIWGLWWDRDDKTSLILRSVSADSRHGGCYCYIRDDSREPTIDLEIQFNIREDGVQTKQWLMCSITRDEYKKLDSCLGPVEDVCCKPFHDKEDY